MTQNPRIMPTPPIYLSGIETGCVFLHLPNILCISQLRC
jgi:hypothetical protein